jgi:hypothetical protein
MWSARVAKRGGAGEGGCSPLHSVFTLILLFSYLRYIALHGYYSSLTHASIACRGDDASSWGDNYEKVYRTQLFGLEFE